MSPGHLREEMDWHALRGEYIRCDEGEGMGPVSCIMACTTFGISILSLMNRTTASHDNRIVPLGLLPITIPFLARMEGQVLERYLDKSKG